MLEPGTKVTRMLGRDLPMEMTIEKVDGGLYYCSVPQLEGEHWTFDVHTGDEVDEEIGWGPKFGVTGSYIILPGVTRK